MILPQVHLRNVKVLRISENRKRTSADILTVIEHLVKLLIISHSGKLTPKLSQGDRPYLKQEMILPPTAIWPVNSIHSLEALGLGCRSPISPNHSGSYLELLPYPGLLARPRRCFQQTLGVKVFRGSPQFDSVAHPVYSGLAFETL
jgi:hypothetical protein